MSLAMDSQNLTCLSRGKCPLTRKEESTREVDALIRQGKRFVILSDRDSDAENAPIPSLLLCSAVHHHLVRERSRTMVGLLVEAGDVREVHHVALLIGFGAAAINPYLALETVEDLARQGVLGDVTPEKAAKYFHKTACFCFNQQTLEAGQSMEFPVSYWVDPKIADDPNTRDVKVITLSHTFFRSAADAAKVGAFEKAGPHGGPLSARKGAGTAKQN